MTFSLLKSQTGKWKSEITFSFVRGCVFKPIAVYQPLDSKHNKINNQIYHVHCFLQKCLGNSQQVFVKFIHDTLILEDFFQCIFIIYHFAFD